MRKSIFSITFLALGISGLFGQSIDEKRMERDLKVAENILSTLIDGESRRRFNNKVESNYMPGFGVIFSVPRINYYRTATVVYEGYDKVKGNSKTYVIESGEDQEEVEIANIKRRQEKEREQYLEEAEEGFRDNITSFLVDYADLIGQIKPSERIVVQSRNNNESLLFFAQGGVKQQQNAFTAQIMKKDLIAYKQGKLDRDEVSGKIEFKKPDENDEVAKDLELFATIFARLYESDLSSTYYISSRNIGYSSLEGYGATFKMKVYSSSSNDGLHTIHTTGETGLTKEERNEKVNAMYPDFEQTLKENIMDYGRTIKSLKPEEMLVMNVALTECIGCEMPKEIEVSVKGKILQNYDKGSISRDEGIRQMKVKKKD